MQFMINLRFFALLMMTALVLGIAGCSASVAQISPYCKPGRFAGDGDPKK